MLTFEKPGDQNTIETLRLAVKTAKERGIRHLVVASNRGGTAKMLEDVDGLNVVIVTQHAGFSAPNTVAMQPEVRAELEGMGCKVLCTGHVLSGAERGLSRRFQGVSPVEVMAATLRMFSQGTKVAVEVATMAADAGLIPVGEPVIAVGGTGRGADSALILHAANSNAILDTKIQEILCKPYI